MTLYDNPDQAFKYALSKRPLTPLITPSNTPTNAFFSTAHLLLSFPPFHSLSSPINHLPAKIDNSPSTPTIYHAPSPIYPLSSKNKIYPLPSTPTFYHPPAKIDNSCDQRFAVKKRTMSYMNFFTREELYTFYRLIFQKGTSSYACTLFVYFPFIYVMCPPISLALQYKNCIPSTD